MQNTIRFQTYKRAHVRSRDSSEVEALFPGKLILMGEGWDRERKESSFVSYWTGFDY